jgi:aryl-alcohol dehydrogenase-like predicted oxidoreductase
MRSLLVRCRSRLVSIDLDQHDVTRIGAIAQHVESQHPGLAATRAGVLVRCSQESVELPGQHSDVHMDDEQAVRHQPSLVDRSHRPPGGHRYLTLGSTQYVGRMEYLNLGHTGMYVSPLCLGAMMFGAWGEPDHDISIGIIHRALDAGINFIDTADVYSQGESEIIVGKALRGRRDDVVLATKFHGPMDVPMGQAGGDPNRRGNSRRWIVQEIENSLRRLQTDWIDLYQVHRPDSGTDDDETIAALTDLQRQGKIRAFGSSTFPAHRMVESQWISEKRGLGRFVTEQPPYSILDRGIERDVLPVAEQFHLGVIPWSPLAGGWLTGRFRKGQEMPQTNRAKRMPARFDLSNPANQAKLDAVEDLALLTEEVGVSLVHLALAFVMQHPGVTAPIIGPRTMEQLDSQLGAVDVQLTTDVLDRIDQIVAPGRTMSNEGNAYVTDALIDPFLRRRRTA